MNVILIGFMGTGKTEVGRLLAKELAMQYVDIDEMIEARLGLSINEIFAKFGEEYFRYIESQTIQELKGLDNRVISTGGGAVLREENVNCLKSLGPLIWLDATPEVIYQRTKHTEYRPLLKVSNPYETIKELLSYRKFFYKKAADFYIDTTDKSIQEVVNICIQWLRIFQR
jgi:shikimate kinase